MVLNCCAGSGRVLFHFSQNGCHLPESTRPRPVRMDYCFAAPDRAVMPYEGEASWMMVEPHDANHEG